MELEEFKDITINYVLLAIAANLIFLKLPNLFSETNLLNPYNLSSEANLFNL